MLEIRTYQPCRISWIQVQAVDILFLEALVGEDYPFLKPHLGRGGRESFDERGSR